MNEWKDKVEIKIDNVLHHSNIVSFSPQKYASIMML